MLTNQSSFNLQSSSDNVTNPRTAAGQKSAVKARAYITVGAVPLPLRDRAITRRSPSITLIADSSCMGRSTQLIRRQRGHQMELELRTKDSVFKWKLRKTGRRN
ncbi:hypothetical protein BLNAU_13897 [Blattamonas nauphoetae]|uniref:Uncharacterized protein n=1 Tax=Blattamonas nauphoetae TaxID=2049346 RepID=A0ABQ9XK03_9EUKA|nr:hypothetical protein BLNAU_13897 [Blattamonas nauphoetae]